MKRIALFSLIALISLGSCKCHKDSVETKAMEQPLSNAITEWQLVNMRGKDITYAEDQSPVTIQFNPEANNVSGCSGCNRYFGDFKFSNQGDITIGDLNGTKMACPEPFMTLERQYMQTLHNVDHYAIEENQLTLMQGDKVVLIYTQVSK